MDKNLRVQLHKALDWMIDNGNLPENDTYELVIQAYKAPYGQPEDHISKGCTAEVDESGIQSSCEFEEDVTRLHEHKTGRMLDLGSGILEYDDVPGMDSCDDYDEEMTKEAQAHLDKVSPGCKFFGQWITQDKPLPVPDNYYHVIRMIYSWGWMGSNFVKTGPELVRILAPGGMMVIMDAAIDKENHGIGSIEELKDHFKQALPGCSVHVEGTEDPKEGVSFNVIVQK